MATELAYAPPMKAGKEGFQGTPELQHRIRITLSSKSVKNLEKGRHLPPLSVLFSFLYTSA
jgi:small subunit ribosomal protein S20e